MEEDQTERNQFDLSAKQPVTIELHIEE